MLSTRVLLTCFVHVQQLYCNCVLGDQVPQFDNKYAAFEARVANRRSVEGQSTLKFVRNASHDAAIAHLRNKALFPVLISASEMPNGKEWNNHAHVLYAYFIHYCAAEGLTMSHDMTRQVMLYLFYGEWIHKKTQRTYSVLRCIHLQATNGRRRFANYVAGPFANLITLLRDKQELTALLLDHGKGEAPAEYLVAVEEGLRAMGTKSVHTMGGGAMNSSESWGKVSPWRKREGYIACVRYYLERGNLRKWQNFSWRDFQERQSARITFEKRHLPLSDGKDHSEFLGLLSEPEDWGKPPKKRVRRKRNPREVVKKESAQKKQSNEVEDDDNTMMMYDPDSNSMVPVITVE